MNPPVQDILLGIIAVKMNLVLIQKIQQIKYLRL